MNKGLKQLFRTLLGGGRLAQSLVRIDFLGTTCLKAFLGLFFTPIDYVLKLNYNFDIMNYSLENKKTDDGFFNKVVMALHQNNLLTNLFRPTRHPERSGATHVGTFDNNRHAAFTLAEVLITLGIIGIVAAMTIPTLLKNYQEKVMVTKVKQAHSQLMNAIQLYTAKNNCANLLCLFDVNKTSDEVAAELASVLKTAKVCTASNNEKYCKYYDVKSNEPYLKDGVYATADGIYNYGRLYLSNGVIFQVKMNTQCVFTYEEIIRDENGNQIGTKPVTTNNCGYIYVDINNIDEPNQIGADIYRYDIKATGEIVPNKKKLLNNALLYNKIEYTPYNAGDPIEN